MTLKVTKKLDTKPLAHEATVYDALAHGLRALLGKECRKATCGQLAFTYGHDHKMWVEAYVERRVRVAVVSDCFLGHGPQARAPHKVIADSPPPTMRCSEENPCASCRAA